jgi:hypothetical protein
MPRKPAKPHRSIFAPRPLLSDEEIKAVLERIRRALIATADVPEAMRTLEHLLERLIEEPEDPDDPVKPIKLPVRPEQSPVERLLDRIHMALIRSSMGRASILTLDYALDLIAFRDEERRDPDPELMTVLARSLGRSGRNSG